MDDVELRIISELSSSLRKLISLCQSNDLRGLTERQIFLRLEEPFSSKQLTEIADDLEC